MKLLRYIMLGAILIFGMTVAVNAQDCESSMPPGDLELGDSFCLQVCGPWNIYSFYITGNPAYTTAEYFPVLVTTAGCSPLDSECDVDCTPLDPPEGEWVLGGDPLGFYPQYYWMGNDCIEFYIQWHHDNYWDFFMVVECDGCFCMTFDSQLPVNLIDFSAVASDGEVSLNWNTASESNADYFEIVRDSETLVEIPAQNSATGGSYSWVDNSVQNGRVYTYELYSVDLNDSRELLSETSAAPSFSTGTVTEYALYQNYPNPFNPETQIAFDLIETQFVTLKVMNLLGQEVATVASSEFDAGRHVVNFNGSNLTSGVYLYTLTAGDFSAAKKLVLLK